MYITNFQYTQLFFICVCHSLNLAASAVVQEFPASTEYLCRQIYNRFSHSSKRKCQYKTLWETLNSNDGTNNESKNFHQFVKLAHARWLFSYNVIKVMIKHIEVPTQQAALVCFHCSPAVSEMLVKQNFNSIFESQRR